MNKKAIIILFMLLIFLTGISLALEKSKDFPDLKGPCLGQKPPGMKPEIFAPGIVSKDDLIEMGCTWSPDGKEFYFGRSETSDIESNWAIWGMQEKNGVWSEPKIVAFSGVYRDFAPFITPDGKTMIFYRMNNQENKTRHGSWIVERIGGAWGKPRFFADAYCLNTRDFRTFYFSTESSEETSRDIGQMNFENGVFSKPIKLPGELNSKAWEAHAIISHDGQFMLFDRVKSTFISFRKDDGTWSRGYDLGRKLHVPCVSPDGKTIFFASHGDIYWVSIQIIEISKPNKLK